MGGGFVFYGGLLFGLAFYFIYSLYLKKFNFKLSYLLLPGLAFGHAIGRVGCFLAGCCFGTTCSYPWATRMHDEFRHPVQLYEVLILLLLGIYILKLIKNKQSNYFIINTYLLVYSAARFFLEFFRGDLVRGVTDFSLSTSQLISILIIAAVLVNLVYRRLK
jgi:phosphatidylglycerol:prolipoprotein diacylglycerol transferase